jgi:hypothetical protein
MSNKWQGLERPIPAEIAEAEPEAQRLFSRPKPPMSKGLAVLFAQVERNRDQRHPR